MTSNGIASSAVQMIQNTPPERVSEQAVERKNEHAEERKRENPAPLTHPQEVPSQVYDSRGRVIPSPAAAGVDLMA